MRCPNCNSENPDGSLFCGSCGSQLSDLSQVNENGQNQGYYNSSQYSKNNYQTPNQGFGYYFDHYAGELNRILYPVISFFVNTDSGFWIAFGALILLSIISSRLNSILLGTLAVNLGFFFILGTIIGTLVSYAIERGIIILASKNDNIRFEYGFRHETSNERDILILIAMGISVTFSIAFGIITLIPIIGDIMAFPLISLPIVFLINIFSISSVMYKYFTSSKQMFDFSKRYIVISILIGLAVFAVVFIISIIIIAIFGGAAFDAIKSQYSYL